MAATVCPRPSTQTKSAPTAMAGALSVGARCGSGGELDLPATSHEEQSRTDHQDATGNTGDGARVRTGQSQHVTATRTGRRAVLRLGVGDRGGLLDLLGAHRHGEARL